MARNATNKLLHKAKKSKSDEFYTQYCDIENELQYYREHFSDKVVYCNCDDPRVSNFFKYFAVNFDNLGLKKLIASCYVENKEGFSSSEAAKNGFYYEYHKENGKKLVFDDISVSSFCGDGDFRSSESIDLLKKSDIVVTNPPFSLFRE
ncbi:adenosine deaminase, partial [Escherichia coli]|nr:adenosine deaminase [Escherichia coli]